MRPELARRFPAPRVAGQTDTGRVRGHNEDHLLLLPNDHLYAVADGVGGHRRGDVASALAVGSLRRFFRASEGQTVPAPPGGPPFGAQRLTAGIRWANECIWDVAHVGDRFHDMGTTLVAAHFSPNTGHLAIAHVGDSRCYRIRDGAIEQLTTDHSLRNDARRTNPNLSDMDVSKLPRNVVTRALGLEPSVKVDVRSEPVCHRDTYLLCSDGLSQMVPDADMLGVMMVTQSLQKACERLIGMANDAGGTDNISVILIAFEEASAAFPVEAPPQRGRLWQNLEPSLTLEIRLTERTPDAAPVAAPAPAPHESAPLSFESVPSREIMDDPGPDITIDEPAPRRPS